MPITQSLIFSSKQQAIDYLLSINLVDKFDGQHFIARYYKDGDEIASVLGIVHNTNGVRNMEIKDGEGGNSDSAMVTNANYVVKKRFPIFNTDKYNYFYDGESVQLELPKIYPGHMAQIILPRELRPYKWDSFHNEDSIIRYAFKGAERVKTYWDTNPDQSSNLMRDFGMETDHNYEDSKVFDIYFVLGDDVGLMYNILNIYNHSDNPSHESAFNRTVVFPNATITLGVYDTNAPGGREYASRIELVVENKTENIKLFHGGWDRSELDDGALLQDDLGEDNFGISYRVDYPRDGVGAIQVDFRNKFRVLTYNNITKETTSPGFRIEAGKVRCYKKSDFVKNVVNSGLYRTFRHYSVSSGAIPNSLYYRLGLRVPHNENIECWQPRTTNGTNVVLYYNPRNVFNCGMMKNTVIADNLLLYSACVCRNKRIAKEYGLLYYKGKVNRKGMSDDSYVNTVVFKYEYIGIEEVSGETLYAFKILRSSSTLPVSISHIGVTFIGTDGHKHYGRIRNIKYVNGQPGDVIPSGATDGIYTVLGSNLEVKEEATGNNYYPVNNIDFSASIQADYLTFDFDVNEMSRNGKMRANRTRKTKMKKWKRLNLYKYYYRQGVSDGDPKLPSKFENQHLNTCKYVKKFKGVKSEYPEIFYTR